MARHAAEKLWFAVESSLKNVSSFLYLKSSNAKIKIQ
jgi:hypothetical protein